MPQSQKSMEVDVAQSIPQSDRRRRGRRGGRRRKSPNGVLGLASGVQPAIFSSESKSPDEHTVSRQLRLLMSARGPNLEKKLNRQEVPDPQLVYTPPAAIESFGAKSNEVPVSAASFNKSESPLQAVVATVGSMAILAALYHFGYWEGRQVKIEAPAYASVAAPPVMATAPDPSLEGLEVTRLEPVQEIAMQPIEIMPVPAPMPAVVKAPELTQKAEISQGTSPKGLYLQVAALKDSSAARNLESRLRTAGFSTAIFEQGQDGLIRVISGPYEAMTEAQGAAGQMAGLGVKPFPRRF